MKKLNQIIASSIFASFAMLAMLSFGMWHWMSIDAMNHGNHECCDFVPANTAGPAKNAFILSSDFPANILASLSYKTVLVAKALPSATLVFPVNKWSFLKGVVQRE